MPNPAYDPQSTFTTTSPNQTEPKRLLSRVSLNTIVRSWSTGQRRLFDRICDLAVDEGASSFEAYGYILAIDVLHNDQEAVNLLITAVAELEVRPSFDEMFQIAERMTQVRKDIHQILRTRRQQRREQAKLVAQDAQRTPHTEWKGPTRTYGFVRKN